MKKPFKTPKRVLIKLSGEMFKWKSEWNFDYHFMKELAEKIVFLTKEKWIQVVIVSGWWNIFRGATDSWWMIETATGHYIGMMATLMNGMAFGDVLENLGQEVRVMSSIEAPRVVETFNRKTALRYLDQWIVVIATAWTGNPFFTNDTAGIQRAIELNCDLFIKWTKVDWVYDKDPMKFKDAKKFDTLTLEKANDEWYKILDHSAIAMALENKTPIFICKIEKIDQVVNEEMEGTYIC